MGVASAQAQEPCGTGTYPFPYTDVASVTDPFCPGIMEAYVTGISHGTTPTTFSPNDDVIRLQMTTFLQRSVDQVLTRGSRLTALNKWWTPQNASAMQAISVGAIPAACAADGAYIWTANNGEVVQVQASTGKVLGIWTGATNSLGVLAVAGKVFAGGYASPGALYVIDPTQAPGPVTVSGNALGDQPNGIAFDGTMLWTANTGGSVSIITPTPPYSVTTVATGFGAPRGILYDGAHIWLTDALANTLLKLGPSGTILQTVAVGQQPGIPAFDGANLWVPNLNDNSITVVQAASGSVLTTISHDAFNQLDGPFAASFDGERILVTNQVGGTVTVFKAADLSVIANVAPAAASTPHFACSDGTNLWITDAFTGNLLKF